MEVVVADEAVPVAGRAEVLEVRVTEGLVLVVQEGGLAAVVAAVDPEAALRGVAEVAGRVAQADRRFIPRMPRLAADSTAARPTRSLTVIDPPITADGITATGTAAGATPGVIDRGVGIGGAAGA